LIIIRIVLSVLSFLFLILAICYFYLSKEKKLIIPKTEKIKDMKSGIAFTDEEAILAGDQIGEYKVTDIVNTINDFTKSFNSINKKTNIASGIVSILSSISLLISAIILKI
jgi:hypothetical protein